MVEVSLEPVRRIFKSRQERKLPTKYESPFKTPIDRDSGSFCEVAQKIFRDEFPVEYPDQGTIEAYNQGLHVRLGFEPRVIRAPPPRQILERLSKRAWSVFFHLPVQAVSKYEGRRNPVLTEFHVTGNGVEQAVQLQEIVPKGWQVVFRPNQSELNGECHPPEKIIAVEGDLTKLVQDCTS